VIPSEIVRYALNGAMATAVHYLVLNSLVSAGHIPSAGLANAIAAVCGITASFVGSRYFVFRASHLPLAPQAAKFAGLYGVLVLMHGAALYLLTDIGGIDYRLGFAVALAVQVTATYVGNKRLVFR
jgi:putative flippase GtrA